MSVVGLDYSVWVHAALQLGHHLLGGSVLLHQLPEPLGLALQGFLGSL